MGRQQKLSHLRFFEYSFGLAIDPSSISKSFFIAFNVKRCNFPLKDSKFHVYVHYSMQNIPSCPPCLFLFSSSRPAPALTPLTPLPRSLGSPPLERPPGARARPSWHGSRMA